MRDDYQEFRQRGAEVLCVSPHSPVETAELVAELSLPFPVLADEQRTVFLTYDVQSRPWSLGQRPGLYVIGSDGVVRWVHLGSQQWEIPKNSEVLGILDRLAQEPPDAT